MADQINKLVGTTVGGRYKILEVIGTGGMGTVYKARQLFMNELVALKILRPEYRDNDVFVERFLREVRNASRVKHPNTIAIYDSGELEDGRLYIAMEYVAGKSLREFLDNHPNGLPVELVYYISRQIAAALGAIHDQDIIHRDLKPDNVLVYLNESRNPRIKVADFGISLANENGALTRTGIIIGTPAYMSPEQGMGRSIDARSDIYSFGVLVFTMLTGRPPYFADSPLGYVSQHNYEPIPTLAARRPDISPVLDTVISRVLAKNPDNRFQTIDGFIAALRSAAVPPMSDDEKQRQRMELAVRGKGQREQVEEHGNNSNAGKEASPTEMFIKRVAIVLLTGILLLGTMLNLYNIEASPDRAENPHLDSLQAEPSRIDTAKSDENVQNLPERNVRPRSEPSDVSAQTMNHEQQQAQHLKIIKPQATPPRPVEILEDIRENNAAEEIDHPDLAIAEVEELVTKFITVNNSGDSNYVLQMYGDYVDYLYHGIVTHSMVDTELRRYQAEWPEAYYRLNGPVKSETLKAGKRWLITFRMNFQLKNPAHGYGYVGLAKRQLTVVRKDGELVIVGDSEDRVTWDPY